MTCDTITPRTKNINILLEIHIRIENNYIYKFINKISTILQKLINTVERTYKNNLLPKNSLLAIKYFHIYEQDNYLFSGLAIATAFVFLSNLLLLEHHKTHLYSLPTVIVDLFCNYFFLFSIN